MCYRCNKKKPNTQKYMNTNTIKVWRLEFGKRVEKAVNEGFFEEKLKAKGWQRVEVIEPETTELTESTEAPKKSRKKKEVENETE